MIEGIAAWWRERTVREQRLLTVMVALLALLVVWLLVIRPLSDALDAAKRRHAEAVTALAQARARAQTARRLQSGRTAPAPLPVENFIRQTAAEAGFANARIVAQGPTRVSFAVDAARAPAFFGWARQMEQRELSIESLRARANSDRTLAVETVFKARGAR